jgi:hypothetical protein
MEVGSSLEISFALGKLMETNGNLAWSNEFIGKFVFVSIASAKELTDNGAAR